MSGPQQDLLTCAFCGELVRRQRTKRGGSVTCPNCGAAMETSAARATPDIVPAKLLAPGPAEPEIHGSQEDDGRAYPVAGGRRLVCPGCQRLLEPEAELCTACGLNWKTGVRATRTYEPARRQWVTGMSRQRRLALFLGGQAVVLSVTVIGSLMQDSPWEFFFPWLLSSTVAAFILGTFDQIELKRQRNGRVELTTRWRVFFFTRPATRIRLKDYEGFTTGVENKSAFFNWLFLLMFLGYGILPGILWWYFAFHRDTYFVALTRDHGFPALKLYSGGSKELKNDICAALQEVAGLSAS